MISTAINVGCRGMGPSRVCPEAPKPSTLEVSLDTPCCHLQRKPGDTIPGPEGFIQTSARPVWELEVPRHDTDEMSSLFPAVQTAVAWPEGAAPKSSHFTVARSTWPGCSGDQHWTPRLRRLSRLGWSQGAGKATPGVSWKLGVKASPQVRGQESRGCPGQKYESGWGKPTGLPRPSSLDTSWGRDSPEGDRAGPRGTARAVTAVFL